MSLGRTLSQVGTIARSIEAFGWDAPLVLEKDKGIVKGHGGYVAAKKLGKKWNNRTSTPVLAHLFFVL